MASDIDPFADGVLEPEEIRGSEPPPEQPFECASCGLAFGDESETTCPACGPAADHGGPQVGDGGPAAVDQGVGAVDQFL